MFVATTIATASTFGSSERGGGFGYAASGSGGHQVPAKRALSLDSAYEREGCGAGEDAEESRRRSDCGDVYGACAASSSAAYSAYGVGVFDEELADRGTGVRTVSRVDELAAGGDDGGERGLSSSDSASCWRRGVGQRLGDSAASAAVGSVLGDTFCDHERRCRGSRGVRLVELERAETTVRLRGGSLGRVNEQRVSAVEPFPAERFASRGCSGDAG